MIETEWVAKMREMLYPEISRSLPEIEIFEGSEIPYGYELRMMGDQPDVNKISFRTDMALIEKVDSNWKPRVIVEAKVRSVTTHDAITYAQKSVKHKAVFPYLRYGVMLGNRKHYPLPGRLYRHGEQFDFMISFRGYDITSKEKETFIELLYDEIKASRELEHILYDSRSRDRTYYNLLHRKLVLKDFS